MNIPPKTSLPLSGGVGTSNKKNCWELKSQKLSSPPRVYMDVRYVTITYCVLLTSRSIHLVFFRYPLFEYEGPFTSSVWRGLRKMIHVDFWTCNLYFIYVFMGLTTSLLSSGSSMKPNFLLCNHSRDPK